MRYRFIKEAKEAVKSLGIVFGDIGTSPIYTITVIFLTLKPTAYNINGVLSLIVWTMITLVTIEYSWLAMSLGHKGEGGTIVLREILVPLLKSGRNIAFVTFITFLGISLLIGDGVITPAISILSAVEGILLIPGLENTGQWIIMLIAIFITFGLFTFQKRGTSHVAKYFGPVMVVWFISLFLIGLTGILIDYSVLKAINPYYAFNFLFHNGLTSFIVLSEVILCATGGEALYADMGHLGRKPILKAWSIVFVVLITSYMGQGAFLLHNTGAHNILFDMVLFFIPVLYVPFLLLSIIATIIASQAMISGMFSIVYQGIMTRIIPMFKIDYTSTELRSQVYIGFVNWFLFIAVVFAILLFKESKYLAGAYGLAVTGTMTFTGFMMTWIFWRRNNYLKTVLSALIFFVDILYLVANLYKLPHGGFWSLVIASLPFLLILLYTRGQRQLYKNMHPMKISQFLLKYEELYKKSHKIKGTALFFSMNQRRISPYIINTMFINNIIYEDNIFVSITKMDQPNGLKGTFQDKMADGLRVFEVQAGYMEIIDIEKVLKSAGIYEKVIFYGLEHIVTQNLIWKLFALVKRIVPTFDEFYSLPADKSHGVINRVVM
ncbi:MAG: KUP/HAK/KT family potassium transporter [Candidatus Margulisbacteria bacterium]|nr:KUP/HAK/KT family potassium transporter [Candidatus Margulisiibacteriota bacterium]